jgi:hypothetical protein
MNIFFLIFYLPYSFALILKFDLYSDLYQNFFASLAGLIAGYLYIQDHTKKLQKFRLPRSIENSAALVGGFFSSLTPPAQIQPNRELQNHLEQQQQQRQQQQQQQQQQQRGRNNIGGWPDIDQSVLDYGGFGAPRASEEAIETLMGLGFERNAVIQALESANGDTEAAANILLR